ncbi:MAG: ribosome-associated translation inhibitor RaiA [Candidatus Paceibacterota bacterium]|jgi:putative sigma-54 modulation protein
MKIDIVGNRIELTPALSSFIEKKMSSCANLVKRFDIDGSLIIFFSIGNTTKHHKHGEVFIAEAMVHLPGKSIKVECTNTDVYAAIDEVKDGLKIELGKYKEKSSSRADRPNKFK